MSALALLTTARSAHSRHLPDFVHPQPSLLAAILECRLAVERGELVPGPPPPEAGADLRPRLPKIAGKSMAMYLGRRVVDSYPLIFTTLALASPN
jgi:hypothetical protein